MTILAEAGFRRVSLLAVWGVCAAAIIGQLAPVSADPIPIPDGAIFRLTPQSEYQHGCFPPCLCPIWVQSGVRGTFKLVRLGPDHTPVDHRGQ